MNQHATSGPAFVFTEPVSMSAAVDGTNVAQGLAKPRPGQRPETEPNVAAVQRLEADLRARGFEVSVFCDSPFLGFLRHNFPDLYRLIEAKESQGTWFRWPRGVEADAQLLALAHSENGVVVSNDGFDAEAEQYPWVKSQPWRMIRVAPLPGGKYMLSQGNQKAVQEEKKRALREGERQRPGILTTAPAAPGGGTMQSEVENEIPSPAPPLPSGRAAPPIAARGVPATPLPALLLNLRKDSTNSVVSSGLIHPDMAGLYVPDGIDKAVTEWLTSPSHPLLILTGSAGHGKSAAMAQAIKLAGQERIELAVRFDATHADRPEESYREALREFLAPFADGKTPNQKHLLAMNLGLALDFFTGNQEDAKQFSRLGALFNETFGLGLPIDAPPHGGVRILDLTSRMKLDFDADTVTAKVPFVERLLERFSPDVMGPVQDAAGSECLSCPRREHCPVLLNVRLLNRPELRDHVAHALAAGALEYGLHLTPRNLLDVISRLLVPPDLEGEVGVEVETCTLRESEHPLLAEGAADTRNWGKRLHLSLFGLAYEQAPTTGTRSAGNGEDLAILRSLDFEDPAKVRAEQWDRQILQWTADPSTLYSDLPQELLDYLGSTEAPFAGAKGLPLFIRSIRWTTPRSKDNVTLIDEFIAICLGNEEAVTRWEPKVTEGLMRTAARRFDDQPVRGTTRLALHLDGVSNGVKILADMLPIQTAIRQTPQGTSLSNPHFIAAVSSREGVPAEEFQIDWHKFQLIANILDGYSPPSTPGPHVAFMEEVARRLAVSSNMSAKVTVHLRESRRPIQLTAKRAGRSFTLNAEAYDGV